MRCIRPVSYTHLDVYKRQANTFVPISIKYTGPTVTSIVGLFEPITSIIMGILFLREPITTKSVLACILILVGVFIVAITKEKKTDN